jgi:hypothetical protein
MNRPHRLAAALLLSCSLLAACGSGQLSSTATGAATSASGGKTRDVEFSDCMRSHGVTNFPDPTSNGLQIPAGIDTRSPAFRAAQQDCKQYLPNGGAPPATPAADRAAALALSRCMRSHGVPQFPDPAFSPPANAPRVLAMRGMVFAIPASVDPKSPAFEQAAHACGRG